MKILQIGLGNNPGGVEAFVMNYYRELVHMDVQFDFLCMYDKIAYEEEIKSLGGRIFYVPNVKKNYQGYVKGVQQVLEQEGYDVVHVNMLSAANLVPLRLAGCSSAQKVIAHSHNASAPGVVRNLMNQWNRPKLQRYASQLFSCGKKAGVWLFGQKAWDAGRVSVVWNAIDREKYKFSPEKRSALRTELGLEGQFVIGHVGRFEAQKNHEKLLDIFAQLLKVEPSACLCLIGDGILKEEMMKKAEQLKISNRILFAGVKTNVEDYLSAMDVFLFPSLFEGLPFTLVEAQANGLPCVISDTITKEVMLPAGPVKQISLQEKEAWVQALLEYRGYQREDEALIAEKLKAAHFDIKEEAKRLKQLYQENYTWKK